MQSVYNLNQNTRTRARMNFVRCLSPKCHEGKVAVSDDAVALKNMGPEYRQVLRPLIRFRFDTSCIGFRCKKLWPSFLVLALAARAL